mmetsp:Transcript_10613/g.20542  ORF Transcript_10613/g.20542 Transcript_10613/m.20542 type:complete len:144 (+) Transcript_10613:307-738(+)
MQVWQPKRLRFTLTTHIRNISHWRRLLALLPDAPKGKKHTTRNTAFKNNGLEKKLQGALELQLSGSNDVDHMVRVFIRPCFHRKSTNMFALHLFERAEDENTSSKLAHKCVKEVFTLHSCKTSTDLAVPRATQSGCGVGHSAW